MFQVILVQQLTPDVLVLCSDIIYENEKKQVCTEYMICLLQLIHIRQKHVQNLGLPYL